MSAVYFILDDDAVMVSAYWGAVDPAQSAAMRDARRAEALERRPQAHVIDLSELVRTNGPPEEEARMYRRLAANYNDDFGQLPTAVIAPTPHTFGLARIFEIVGALQDPPVPVRIVITWEEAAEYLELDLTAARARRDALHALDMVEHG